MDTSTVITSAAAILTAVGAAFAAWEKWGKSKADTTQTAANMTLDGVFRLVEQLQKEVVRKAEEIAELDKRCDEQKKVLEDRIVVNEAAIANLVRENEELRKQMRELRNGKG